MKRYYGETFYVARVQLKMTQTELARNLGISQSAVSKLESDRLEPSATDLIWLVKRLMGVDLVQHLETALVPGRLKIESDQLTKEHKEKKHKEPNKQCPTCVAALERAAREVEQIEDRRRAMWAKVHGKRLV